MRVTGCGIFMRFPKTYDFYFRDAQSFAFTKNQFLNKMYIYLQHFTKAVERTANNSGSNSAVNANKLI